MNGTLERTCHRGMDPGAPTGWSWGRFLVLHPITLTTAISLGLAIGWLAGMVWACAGIVAITALTLVAARSRLVKGAIVRAMAAAARGRRDDARDSLMERSGSPRRGDLAELVALVRAIERGGAIDHAGLELEELLDLFVDRAVAQERYRGAVRNAAGLEPKPLPARDAPACRHADVLRRRIEHRDECQRRIDELEGELDAILELVRLIAQRAACPSEAQGLDDAIANRLWELDARDGAMRQLSPPSAG